ncbi:LptA/OstA family protein [Azotosporobacter soli]|uniref:LptA/OstA family protein n=1 Tax=Azotosporobacter soli TaxID=3055040 RepID=UPI0031FED0B0
MKSRISISLLVLLLLFCSSAFAAKPVIKADQQYLDINTGLYVLNGHVYIEGANRVITAGQAKINMSSMEVWASEGVSLRQDDIYFTGDTVYIYGTQNRADITGNVTLSRSGLKIQALQTEYNWDTKVATFTGQVQVAQDGVPPYTVESLNYNVVTNTIL